MPDLFDRARPRQHLSFGLRVHHCVDSRLAEMQLRILWKEMLLRFSWFDLAIVKSLRAGKLVYPGPTDVPHAWAYLPDLARVFVAPAGRDAPRCAAFERFHFAGHTLTGDELLRCIEQAAATLGLTPDKAWSQGGMPWGVIRLGGRVVPPWRELAEMAYLWKGPHALDGRAIERAVGPLPVTAVADALRETLCAIFAGKVPARPALTAAAG